MIIDNDDILSPFLTISIVAAKIYYMFFYIERKDQKMHRVPMSVSARG